ILEDIMRKKGQLNRHHKPLTVHRLDRDTSGVMMFAVTEIAQKKIMDTWHQMVTERLYRAVAENPRDPKKFLPDEGLIDDPLAFNAYNVGFVPKEGDKPKRIPGKHEDSIYKKNISGKGDKMKFKTVPARTNYKVIARGKTYTLFELSLDTGKKNQIRAHLASKGYPLAGDENFRAKTNPFGRLALHARTLEFDHPFTGEHMKFECPEPSDWKV
ncbi:MAG: RluA family pseudouridine synthase, partial [Fibrobacter sp.]|nr:RluA family pseudouridine synthase [Fibrobacter sp.]